ncbi:permease-like cell division protein FtsX [Patescibacteria group bacterium]|nr:permease-like cell division protein FtsX [Patescibacteria group bacterium]MBU1868018.1 permease-like cell division protein FtsX [Patescibacteria group bacterium]
MIETVRLIIKNTFQHLARNFWHSVAAILVMTLALYSVVYFTASAYRYNEALRELRSKPQLTVFFKDEATEEEILNWKKSLEARNEVKEANYISKEEALVLYQQENQERPELLEFVTADILPASLEISTTEVEYQESIARELANSPRIESIIFHSDVVQKLLRLSNAMKVEGFVWAGSLLTVAIITILVVVGISISSYGEEIEIMKLVGAGSWYVRFPFVIQGIIYGVVAAALAIGMLYAMPYLKTAIVGETDLLFLPGLGTDIVSSWVLLRLWGAATIFGIVLGALASWLATWRYLRV